MLAVVVTVGRYFEKPTLIPTSPFGIPNRHLECRMTRSLAETKRETEHIVNNQKLILRTRLMSLRFQNQFCVRVVADKVAGARVSTTQNIHAQN